MTTTLADDLTPTLNNAQSPREEFFNALTHGVGALMSACALVLLAVEASEGAEGWTWELISALVFGAALTTLYVTSSLYHAMPVGRVKELFRSFDHMGIYVLIAGTYTVVALTALRDSVGWGLVGAQWGMAATGITLKSIYGPDRFNLVSTLGYVVMGWMALVVFGDLVAQLPPGALHLLFAGGVFYTLGVPFFLLDQSRPFFHTIWHLFVMAGSTCHFLMAWLYLL